MNMHQPQLMLVLWSLQRLLKQTNRLCLRRHRSPKQPRLPNPKQPPRPCLSSHRSPKQHHQHQQQLVQSQWLRTPAYPRHVIYSCVYLYSYVDDVFFYMHGRYHQLFRLTTMKGKHFRLSSRGPLFMQWTKECTIHIYLLIPSNQFSKSCLLPFTTDRRLRDPSANEIPDDFVTLWQDAVKSNSKVAPLSCKAVGEVFGCTCRDCRV